MIASQKPHHEYKGIVPAVVQWFELQFLEQPDKGFQGRHVQIELLLLVHRLRNPLSLTSISISETITHG